MRDVQTTDAWVRFDPGAVQKTSRTFGIRVRRSVTPVERFR